MFTVGDKSLQIIQELIKFTVSNKSMTNDIDNFRPSAQSIGAGGGGQY